MEGEFKEGDRVLLLDDVVMTGGTLVKDIPVGKDTELNIGTSHSI